MNKDTTYCKVTLCNDGKYRWIYEINLYKNPIFFFLVWKIFFFIFVAVFAVVNTVDYVNLGAEKTLENLPFLGYFFVGMTAVIGLGYLIYAIIMGGKYTVEFEMDENGVNHKQIKSQAKRAENVARLTMMSGAASGRIGMVGTGMNAMRTEMYTGFAKVRKIKAYPRRHVIKLKETLEHNQVYVSKDDFAFVLDYMISHCPNIKK